MSLPPPPPQVKVRQESDLMKRMQQKHMESNPVNLQAEFQNKHKPVEEISEDLASELISDGIKTISQDKTNYVECLVCKQMINPAFFNLHQQSHSSQILPWLYLGGDSSAGNYAELTERVGIKVIINCALECGSWYPDEFEYHSLNMDDSLDQSLKEAVYQCFDILEQAKNNDKKVLVHCAMGISRSAAIVIGYLILSGYGYQEAFCHVKDRRPIIQPNPNFLAQLQELSRETSRY